jgi:hypothetical protein
MKVSDHRFVELIEPVARLLLGEPNRAMSNKDELRYGTRGSLSVDLKKGTWFDHETGTGGGALDLIARETGLTEKARSEWMDEHGFHVDRDDDGAQQRRKSNGSARINIVKTYDYVDETGKLLFQVCRLEPKDFRQRKPDSQTHDGWKWSVRGVRNVPYRLPELIEAIARGQTICIVEGEKDADNLWNIGIPATCNAGGVGKWRDELTDCFCDADVVVIEDNDPQKKHPKTGALMFHEDGRAIMPGQDHARAVAEALTGVAERVRLLKLNRSWPGMPPKGDVSDWLDAGHTREQLDALIEALPVWTLEEAPGAMPVPVVFPFPIDEAMIPVRDWVVPGLLMRRHVSVLVAPSGSGKSLLTLQLGIACALHKPWSGWLPRRKFRVLVINSEDDVDEMRRRLAAAARIMVPSKDEQDCLRNNVALVDNADGAVVAKFDAKTKTMIATPLLDQIIATIKQNEIDIIFVDPFAETFEGDENSNSELKWAGVMWRHVARETGAAVCLVHHTKKYATGMAGDVDAARGAGALIGIARIVSTLFPMTTREAEVMGVEDDKRGFYLRYDDAKANLNIKSPFARWFFKQTITLDNKTDELPGDDVGVLIPWKPSGPTVLEDQIVKFFTRIDQGIVDQAAAATGEFYSFDPRSGERWVVKFAQEFFEIESEAAAAKLIEGWRRDKRLESVQHRSGKQRKVRGRCISELDPNAPKNRKARAADQPQEVQDAFDYER